MSSLLLDLGQVLRHAAGDPMAATGQAHGDLADRARRLLAFACDMGWTATAAAVLPLACAKCECAAEVVAALHSVTAADGLTLLHRSVQVSV